MQQEQGCADSPQCFHWGASVAKCHTDHWFVVFSLSGTYTWEEKSAQMSLGLNGVQKEILQNAKLDLVLDLGQNMRLLIFSTLKWRALLRHSFRVDYLRFMMFLPLHQLLLIFWWGCPKLLLFQHIPVCTDNQLVLWWWVLVLSCFSVPASTDCACSYAWNVQSSLFQ